MILTRERLAELLSYDPDTGVFIRRVSVSNNKIKAGSIAGSRNNQGYLTIMVDGRARKAHRLAWLYVHGRWPADQLDHINGVKDDNRIANLREATHSINMHNQRVAHKNNISSGLLGVAWFENSQKWVAKLSLRGRRLHLGYFNTKEEAHAAYLAAKRRLHEGCTI